MARHAVARQVAETLNECCLEYQHRVSIDVALAQRQHQAYVQTLGSLGLTVHVLPADNKYPDCCFVEDLAIVLDDCVVVCRMGTDARNGEQAAIVDHLRGSAEIVQMAAPATLEGGDVLAIGRQLFVGRSNRTNDAGISFLREVATRRGYEVVGIPVAGALHLKTAGTYLGDQCMLAAPHMAQQVARYIPRCRIIETAVGESGAANTLTIGNAVLMPSGYPATAIKLAAAGFDVHTVDISEFEKAEGGVTCLSVIL